MIGVVPVQVPAVALTDVPPGNAFGCPVIAGLVTFVGAGPTAVPAVGDCAAVEPAMFVAVTWTRCFTAAPTSAAWTT